MNIKPEVHYCNYINVIPGKAWGPRTIPDFELILIVAGEFTYFDCSAGEITMLNEGEVLCIPPGEKHVLKCESGSGGYAAISCIHLEFSDKGFFLNDDYILPIVPPLVTDVRGDGAIHELFRNCRNTFESFGKYRMELLSTMTRELYLRLAEYWEGASEKKISSRMRRMLIYLQGNIEHAPGRRELSREFNLSVEHINFMFKKELGVSPGAYLRRLKIFRACRYLSEDGLSVKETADRLGFYDEFYFSKVFKKIMGSSPSKFKGK